MNMKTLVSILFSLLFINLEAQNNLYVEYYTTLNSLSTKGVLIADRTMAIYNEGKENFETELSNRINENAIETGNFAPSVVYKTLENPNTIFLDQVYRGINYKSVDEKPDLDWKFEVPKTFPELPKTKKIAGYDCLSATVNFRGSTFLAYYTSDIPTTFGPWKFSGLPGLILEISSLDNPGILWVATNVVYPYAEVIDFTLDKEAFNMSFKDYILQTEKVDEEHMKILTAKIGNGATFTIEPGRRYLMTRERKYEW